jgi:hypothetical protein
MLRKPPFNIPRHSVNWNPQGTRKVGRLKQAWRRIFETEQTTAGLTQIQVEKTSIK